MWTQTHTHSALLRLLEPPATTSKDVLSHQQVAPGSGPELGAPHQAAPQALSQQRSQASNLSPQDEERPQAGTEAGQPPACHPPPLPWRAAPG